MNHPLRNEKTDKPTETPQDEGDKGSTPSWFTQTYRNEESEFLVDHYKRKNEQPAPPGPADSEAYDVYRKRMMERLREQNEALNIRTTMPPLPPRPVMPPETIRAQDQYIAATRQNQRSSSFSRFAVSAGIAAIVAGGSLGFAMTHLNDIKKSAGNMFTATMGDTAPTAVPAPAVVKIVSKETSISKKPISIASLKVEDAAGSLNSMIPLMLQADPATAGQELTLQITGVPKSAYLNKGTRTSDTTWQLKDGEEAGLNLVVPSSDTPKIDMSVAAIEVKTGELAAPVQEMTVALDDQSLQITPANAVPESSTVKTDAPALAAANPVSQPLAVVKPELSAEVTGLLQKGDMLFKAGDVAIARQFYSRAFEMGAADGALGVARSYDPAIFKQMNIQGIKPDQAMAAQWYDKAKAAGATIATPPVAALP